MAVQAVSVNLMMRTTFFVLGWYAIVFVTLALGLTLEASGWVIAVVTFVALLSFAGLFVRRTMRRRSS